MKIGLFYGSSTCYTEMVAEKIQALLRDELVCLHNLKDTPIDEMTRYPVLMLGISTWDFGEIQEDWLASWDALDTLDLDVEDRFGANVDTSFSLDDLDQLFLVGELDVHELPQFF